MRGRAAFYVAFKCYSHIDVAHPVYLRAQRELLTQYADIPLDGVGWDEPGKGLGNPCYFKAGEGFLQLFKKRNGYDLRPCLIHMDHEDATSKAVKVRSDYHATLNEMNFNAQDQHNRFAEKLFGKDKKLIFGTHHTWSGLPMDLAAGVIDYFKLGKLLTAAWTDGSWDYDLRYPALNFTLADGIRRELGLRDAYYNDWTARLPVVENMRFANRYKKLFHVNWFNIFFSDYSESLINWRLEPARSAAKADVADLDAFDRMLAAGGFSPHSNVAWLYLWEGVAAAPKWLVRSFYTFCSNTAQHLVDRGVYATMMGTDSIRRSKALGGEMKVGDFSYRAVIVPYAHAMPKDVYKKLTSLAEAGVRIIFIGPPPEFTTDGVGVGADFARRVGMRQFSFTDYQKALAEMGPLPSITDWEPDWMDFSYPVSLTDGVPTWNSEGEIVHVKARDQHLYYMSSPDPREDLCALLGELVPPPLEAYCDHAYHRMFTAPGRKSECVLLVVAHGRVTDTALVPCRLGFKGIPARKPGQLKAMFRIHGAELTLNGGSWCALRVKGSAIVDCVGDCPEIKRIKS